MSTYRFPFKKSATTSCIKTNILIYAVLLIFLETNALYSVFPSGYSYQIQIFGHLSIFDINIAGFPAELNSPES